MKIALFGGGPACLMAALVLCKGHEVVIYEKGKRIGRKFLVAGNGGFNLTNAKTGEGLLEAYTDHPVLREALSMFNSEDTRKWLQRLGVNTFVGSSGRVFPEKELKPAQVLKKITDKLASFNVQIRTDHTFVGFDTDARPIVKNAKTEFTVVADKYIFGLGGGSWKKTGSNNAWLDHFRELGIKTGAFEPSNCGVEVRWGEVFFEKYQGTPLKNIRIYGEGFELKGEALITDYGLEGNVIYPIVGRIRDVLKQEPQATFWIDFKPNNTKEELVEKALKYRPKPKNYRYTFNMDKVQLALVKSDLSKDEYLDVVHFARQVKAVPVTIEALRSVEESISTIGGIDMDELNGDYSLKKHKHLIAIGEMLDWDAPTGGFLLQACFSTGWCAAKMINEPT